MTFHQPPQDDPAERPAEYAPGRDTGGAPREGSRGGQPFENAEAALGGADAVEKTSAIVGSGTEPEARHTGSSPAAANLPSGRGLNLVAWIVAGIGGVIALVYLLGLLG